MANAWSNWTPPAAAPTGSRTYRQSFAGDTFNMAWYLRRLLPLPWQVDYLTAIGDDAMSSRILAFMQDARIGTDHVAVRQGGTPGLCLISVQDCERSFFYWRGQSAARTLAADPVRLDQAFADALVLVFSGITLAILPEPDRSVPLDALGAARRAGSGIMFDPNLRPRLWRDGDELRAFITKAAEVADLILPSFEDVRMAFGDPSPAATAARYAGLGADEVVLRDGAGEMRWLNRGQAGQWTPPPASPIVDTTAAGDSFNAAYLSARIDGTDPALAVARASSIAEQVIARHGALIPE